MKNKRRFRPPRFGTVIGSDTVIRGDVEFAGGLHLDGHIQGNVTSRDGDEAATLTVSDTGQIEGDVAVANIILNGMVHGDVQASGRVELADQARVAGRVCYRLLEMAMGAEVNGELVHADDAPDHEVRPEAGETAGVQPRPSNLD
jgi:cytoskeletal protein CcmA (bactofilin family)